MVIQVNRTVMVSQAVGATELRQLSGQYQEIQVVQEVAVSNWAVRVGVGQSD